MESVWRSVIMRYPNLGDALLWLGVMAGIAIVLGALSRTKPVKMLNMPLLVLASAVYAYSVWQAATIVPTSHWADSWGVAALIVAVNSVFMLGTVLVCSQDISYKNGALGIKQDSLIYKAIDFYMPSDWYWDDGSLCRASWVAGGAGILVVLMYVLAGAVNVVTALGFFFWNGSNPFLVWLDAMEDFGIENKHKRMKYWGNTPRSPGLLLLALGGVYGIWWVSVMYTATSLIVVTWLGIMIACALAFMLFARFLRLFDSKKKTTNPDIGDVVIFGVCAGVVISSIIYLGLDTAGKLLLVVFGSVALLPLWLWLGHYRQDRNRAEQPLAATSGETAEMTEVSGMYQPLPAPKPNLLAQMAMGALGMCWNALRLCWSLLLAIKGLACPRVEIT